MSSEYKQAKQYFAAQKKRGATTNHILDSLRSAGYSNQTITKLKATHIAKTFLLPALLIIAIIGTLLIINGNSSDKEISTNNNTKITNFVQEVTVNYNNITDFNEILSLTDSKTLEQYNQCLDFELYTQQAILEINRAKCDSIPFQETHGTEDSTTDCERINSLIKAIESKNAKTCDKLSAPQSKFICQTLLTINSQSECVEAFSGKVDSNEIQTFCKFHFNKNEDVNQAADQFIASRAQFLAAVKNNDASWCKAPEKENYYSAFCKEYFDNDMGFFKQHYAIPRCANEIIYEFFKRYNSTNRDVCFNSPTNKILDPDITERDCLNEAALNLVKETGNQELCNSPDITDKERCNLYALEGESLVREKIRSITDKDECLKLADKFQESCLINVQELRDINQLLKASSKTDNICNNITTKGIKTVCQSIESSDLKKCKESQNQYQSFCLFHFAHIKRDITICEQGHDKFTIQKCQNMITNTEEIKKAKTSS